MSAAPQRELRGASAGAAAVLVDRGSDELVRSAVSAVRAAGLDGRIVLLCAPGRAVGSELAALGLEVAEASGPAQALTVLADVAAAGPTSLALLDTALVARPVALLDVLDRPRAKTMAWVVEDRDRAAVIGGADPSEVWPRVRHSPGRGALVESVASPVHHVGVQTGWAVGLLRLAPADLPAAVAAWRAAVTVQTADGTPVMDGGTGGPADGPAEGPADGLGPTFAMALVSLTRSGLAVSAELLGGWRVGCAAGPSTAAAALAAGGPQSDDWRTRLVEARRPVDGLYSTFVVRAVSRRITWRLLPTGISPNAVTVFSFGLGILAAVLCAVGGYAALVAAAVILQVSLVLDCVDGEIARYTRRYSPLGAWLDVTGDRIKEYGVFAGLALSSARAGDDIWWLALLALALVAYRHFVDYGYGVTVRAAHAPVVAVLPLDQRDDGPDPRPRRAAGRLAGVISATDSTSSRAIVHWAKKALHLPIGERYLLLSLTMLTGDPELVLAVLVVLEVPSVLYTTPGRVLRSVSGG